MKSFFGFLIKEFFHILRDKRTMLILFGMPLAQLTIFGFAIRNEVKDAGIVIIDQSKDNLTMKISNKVLSSGYFRQVRSAVSVEDIDSYFREGEVKLVLIMEPKFEANLTRHGYAAAQIIADASEPNSASLLVSYLSTILADVQRELRLGGDTQIASEVKLLYNPEMKSVFLFVPGLIALILMLICALMTSITITREKEQGTMEILLVSPLRPIQIITGKVIPYFLLSIVNVVTVLLLSQILFEVPFKGSYVLFFFEAGLFITAALSLGILISTVADTQQTAMMMSLAGLMLPVVILSGFIFPIASMPLPLQWLSNIVPAKWFLIVVRGIMLKGVGLGELWKETLILGGMTVFLLTVSVKRFKIRL